jgi:hypothetical protein
MFEERPVGRTPSPEVIARFDALFDHREGLTAATDESVGWVERIRAAARVANQAAGAELVAIGELFGYRLAQSCETADWAIDTEAAVAAEVGARTEMLNRACRPPRRPHDLHRRRPRTGLHRAHIRHDRTLRPHV